MSTETEIPVEVEAQAEAVSAPADDIHPVSRYFLFLGNEKVKRNFIWFPLAGMIISILLGLHFKQKHPLPIEEYIPGSWAIYGFLAYSLIVLSAGTLFKILGRDESYYGEGGLPDPDYSTDPMVTGQDGHGVSHHD